MTTDSRADMKDRTQKGSNSPEGSADFASLAYAETSSRPLPLKKNLENLQQRSHGSNRELYRVRGAEKQASESMADPPAGGGGGLGRLREDKKNGGRELSHSDEDGTQQQKNWVEWDRFLPQRQLRVLLVENDDSTRHVVAALLHKCSYEVSCACNGLEAWEILNDPSNHFDLVLTEVVMPCMSGIALLCKIMSHEAYKHIPVIMMSAHDSMGIVFKCLSKGAVDFLVKPVRKNELKNLWQHVWRRCQSSSGSGNGSETLDVPRSKSGGSAASGGNNTGSNDGNDNVSSDVNVLDGSDNGSGTQSSWTKRAVEIESPRCRAAVQEQPVRAHKVENPQRIQAASGIEIADGQAVQREIDANMGQDVEVVKQKVPHCELQNAKDKTKPTNSIYALKHDASSTDSREREQVYEVPVVDTGTIRSRGPSIKASGLICSKACINKERDEEQGDSGLIVEKNIPPSQKEKGDSCSSLLESALKRPRIKHMQGEVQERLTLRHSGSSAFSRYNASSNVTLPLSGVSSKGIICHQGVGYMGYSVGCSSGSGMSKPIEVAGSSKGSANIHSQPSGSISDNPMAFSGAVKDEHLQGMPFPLPPRGIHSPTHALFSSRSNTPQLVATTTSLSPQNTDKGASLNNSLVGLDGHTHSHAHHYHCPPSSSHQSKPSMDNALKPQREEADMSGSRVHMVNGTMEVMNGQSGSSNNYGYASVGNGSGSVNRSATGSNTDDGHNLVSLMSARNSIAMASNGGDQIRVAIREAALNKFRQKRKERCYGKKVRYQSRKKLAEQRPRVRGQFVRQNVYTGGEEE